MKDKCNCKPGMGIVALILAVVGFYSVILGIKTQLASSAVYNNWSAMLFYLVGIVVLVLAKKSKWKAFNCCDAHRMK